MTKFNDNFDTRAIKIEYIAKNQDETSLIEEELEYDSYIENSYDINIHESISNLESDEEDITVKLDALLDEDYNEDYVDAFENVVYFDELGLDDEELDDLTEEIYPGVRKIKPKKENEEEY